MASNVGRAVAHAIRSNSKDIDVIHPNMNLEIDLGLDSLARAETFAALEQAFSSEFDGEEAAQALTVGNVIELIKKHAGEDASASSIDLNWGEIVRSADDDFPEVRAVLKPRPFFAVFAFLFYKLFHLFCRVFMLLEVRGSENIKSRLNLAEDGSLAKPFLICPNHQSFLDPFVICSNYPYRLFKNIFHVGASEFFEGSLMRSIAQMLNVVPVNPDTELMRAMKAGAIGLKNGRVLNIYPEGERAFDGELHGFKKGAAILATELDMPIIPVAIDGLYKVWPRNSWRIRPAKVKITFGEPIDARKIAAMPALDSGEMSESSEAATSKDLAYERVTAHLKQTISEMIEEMRR
jgi:long-chain acyl-CoA synthetase